MNSFLFFVLDKSFCDYFRHKGPFQNCLLWERAFRDTVISPLNVGTPTETVVLAFFLVV
ncbi:hypothetical protein LEP1GSC133_1937 [Leptospira borgpetersenii serovar Pomona str. 200901868]|uniref:Uncharacterized protein n=1 Tax=Leptospira borgpetersenii serovar Pomona str. 200901868 TaxID=1192866 RepID=M6WG02_LEPBO|nr:hypothetical protein LEP1GSC133_1937 [Leptospira borgpetersenii serovar Pomona str. 200901868]